MVTMCTLIQNVADTQKFHFSQFKLPSSSLILSRNCSKETHKKYQKNANSPSSQYWIHILGNSFLLREIHTTLDERGENMATSKAADRGEGKSLSYIVLASSEKGFLIQGPPVWLT